MSGASRTCLWPAALLALAVMIGMTGCASLSGGAAGGGGADAAAMPHTDGDVEVLRDHLVALAPTVEEEEAWRLAECASTYSRELAQEYRVVRPAVFHNFLVNIGIRKRGLCYQWAEDLLAKLETLNLTTLELRWGMARAGTVREHNCVVVTAPGRPFEEGIVLDAWRHSGRLVWAPVAGDRYPWVEGVLITPP